MAKEIDKQEPFKDITSEMLADAMAGAVTGGGLGALIGGMGPLAKRLIELSREELIEIRRRKNEVWEIAAEVTGHSPEELAEVALVDRDKGHLAVTATGIAGTSRIDAKIRVLGEALASGLIADDDVTLDLEQQVVDALERVERPHVALMWSMIATDAYPDTTSWIPLSLGWGDLVAKHGSYRKVLPRLLAQLDRDGLIERHQTAVLGSETKPPGREDYEGVFWMLTTFGLEVLARLYKAGLENPHKP